MKRLLVAVVSMMAVAAVCAEGFAAVPVTLVYTGSIKDSRGTPIGGIYWLRFSLHRDAKEVKTLWSEEMYVAVDKGSYQVELGKERQVPQSLALPGLFLSIAVDGVEVQRVQVDESMVSGGVKKTEAASGTSQPCTSCEVAERSLDSEKIGGMTTVQLLDTLAKKQVAVGTTSHFTASAGTGEGTPFRLSCPPGFVVTGIKGMADDKIGNIQLVCSPLESK